MHKSNKRIFCVNEREKNAWMSHEKVIFTKHTMVYIWKTYKFMILMFNYNLQNVLSSGTIYDSFPCIPSHLCNNCAWVSKHTLNLLPFYFPLENQSKIEYTNILHLQSIVKLIKWTFPQTNLRVPKFPTLFDKLKKAFCWSSTLASSKDLN